MIVRDNPRPWQLLFILRGSIVPAIWPQVTLVVMLSALITTLDHTRLLRLPPISPLPFSLIGIALSIFAGFRNSACYERWWEARKLLGQLVIESRSLGRESMTHLDESRGQRLVYLTLAFAVALKSHLRGESPAQDLTKYMSRSGLATPANLNNPPDRILGLMSREVAAALKASETSPPIGQLLEERIISMSAVLAACERIKFTPLPFAYSLLLHRTAYMFCFLLPFGLAESSGLWTPLLSAILAYTFFGLDALGDELAAPFGGGDNSLPLVSIVRTIEINLLEQLGSGEVPSSVLPKDYVLD